MGMLLPTQSDRLMCFSPLIGMVMAMFTAAPLCCLMDFSPAGASICASTLAGWLFGTEGEFLDGTTDNLNQI